VPGYSTAPEYGRTDMSEARDQDVGIEGTEDPIVGAAEDHRVDAALAERGEVPLRPAARHGTVEPAFLREGDEQRTGSGVDLERRPERAERPRVGARGNRRIGADHPDPSVPRARHRRAGPGLDH